MITNFTGKESQITRIEQLYCSAQLGGNVHGYLILLSVINIFLSITAFLGNTLILVALRKETSLHPPSKLLYRNLAISDLCVGIIVEPAAVSYWISEVIERSDICLYALDLAYVTAYVLCSLSLGTTTFISVDRLLALLLGLRYRQVITLKRTYLTIIFLWAISSFAATTYFVSPVAHPWFGNIALSLCLAISIFSYTKIFLTLRYNHIQPRQYVWQAQSNQATLLKMAIYKKAVVSALWIQITLVVCCLPFFFALVITPEGDPLPYYIARQFGAVFIYLNSSLNPLLYCWKIKEVRQAVKDTIKQVPFRLF